MSKWPETFMVLFLGCFSETRVLLTAADNQGSTTPALGVLFHKGLSAAYDNARINLNAVEGSYHRKRDSRSSYLAAGSCQLHGEYCLPMMSEQAR
jgi:hypothetical protein